MSLDAEISGCGGQSPARDKGAIQPRDDQRKPGELEEIPLQCAESACAEERDKAARGDCVPPLPALQAQNKGWEEGRKNLRVLRPTVTAVLAVLAACVRVCVSINTSATGTSLLLRTVGSLVAGGEGSSAFFWDRAETLREDHLVCGERSALAAWQGVCLSCGWEVLLLSTPETRVSSVLGEEA